MRYLVHSAFFCRNFKAEPPDKATYEILRSLASHPKDTADVQVLIELRDGPANAEDTASLGLLLPDGRNVVIGPERLKFSPAGRATLVFFFHAMPLNVSGVVSAQLLFSGERQAAPVCGLLVVRPKPKAESATVH
jgi:hypothetical protein